MTTKEYFTAKRMWAEGFTAQEIGDTIGYTDAYVYQTASRHREDFPKRPRTVSEPEMRHFCALAESYGTAIAARKAGVTQRTINRRVAVLRGAGRQSGLVAHACYERAQNHGSALAEQISEGV